MSNSSISYLDIKIIKLIKLKFKIQIIINKFSKNYYVKKINFLKKLNIQINPLQYIQIMLTILYK